MLAAERSRASSLVTILRLLRVQNGAIAALGVLVGAAWANGAAKGGEGVLVVALAAIALAGFANATNDYCDVEIDRVAHPERPLPSGALAPGAAIAAAIVAGGVALALTALVSIPLATLTVGVLAAMAAYSVLLARTGVVGNLVVALLASLPFLYGAWAAGSPVAGLPLVGVAVPLHFAREVAKDLDDAPGDAPWRATLPVRAGAAFARWTAVAATAIFGGAVALLAGGRLRLWLALVPALLCATAAAVRLARGRARAATLYKAAMVCAMIALLV